jgi:hypothetical protein
VFPLYWIKKLKVKHSRYMPWRRLGESRYSSYSFLTSALDEWSASSAGRALAPLRGPPVPTVQDVVWVPEQLWTQRLEGKPSAPAEDQPRSPGRPDLNQTLYWLSYPGSFVLDIVINSIRIRYRITHVHSIIVHFVFTQTIPTFSFSGDANPITKTWLYVNEA